MGLYYYYKWNRDCWEVIELDEDKIELVTEIARKEDELRELKARLRSKKRFKHSCPNCRREWEGIKENITECTFCHQRIKSVKAEEIPSSKVDIGSFEENCAKFDAMVRAQGEIVKRFRRDKTKDEMLKTLIFRAKDDGFEYIKKDLGVELVHKTVKSTAEVLKDFYWKEFLKGYTWNM